MLVAIFGVERLCFKATAGFRPYKIISDLPIDARYVGCDLDIQEKAKIEKILSQSFHYIGHGGCVYCFASEDGKYVIKFFKHQHLSGRHILEYIPLQGRLASYRDIVTEKWHRGKAHKRKDFLFTSIRLAFDHLKEETGLIFLQLSRSGPFQKELILFDKIGCKHTIPLKETEFILQKKAEMILPFLFEAERSGRLEEGKKVIDSLFTLLEKREKMGITDRDPALDINFGVVDGMAVEIDVGSFCLTNEDVAYTHQKNDISMMRSSLSEALKKTGALALGNYVKDKSS